MEQLFWAASSGRPRGGGGGKRTHAQPAQEPAGVAPWAAEGGGWRGWWAACWAAATCDWGEAAAVLRLWKSRLGLGASSEWTGDLLLLWRERRLVSSDLGLLSDVPCNVNNWSKYNFVRPKLKHLVPQKRGWRGEGTLQNSSSCLFFLGRLSFYEIPVPTSCASFY